MGVAPQAPLERRAEVTLTEGHQVGQLTRTDLRSEVSLDVRKSPLGLPARQAAGGKYLMHEFGARLQVRRLRSEQAPDIDEAPPGCLVVILQQRDRLPDEISYPLRCTRDQILPAICG